MYSLLCRLDVSVKYITLMIVALTVIYAVHVYVTSKLHSICIATLYNLATL